MATEADRLSKAREAAGFHSAAEAAEALGMTYSTYAAHENGTRGYRKYAEKYARKFNVDITWLLTGHGSPAISSSRELTQINYNVFNLAVTGIVDAGAWRDVNDTGSKTVPDFVPASPDYDIDYQCAYLVNGPSLNKIARDGDILVCIDIIKSGIDIKDSDLVVVEHSRYDGQQILLTAKRIRKTLSGFELWPESDHPDYQEPIALNGAEESDELRVVAKVLWVARKP